MQLEENQDSLVDEVQKQPTLANNILTITARAVALTIFSLLLGCGFSLNPNATSPNAGGSGDTGGAGDPIGTGGQPIPSPAVSQPLTGCANPNTGVSSGDWGVATNPVYTVVDNTAPVVGMPIYQSNTIFWTSRENAPGQSILLTGAFTDATKTARLALIPSGTIDWQTVVRASTTIIPTTQQGTTGLSFIVPASFPAGVYGFEIDDPSAPPILGLANVPSLNWAIGVPSTTDSESASAAPGLRLRSRAGRDSKTFRQEFRTDESGCFAVICRGSALCSRPPN